MLNGFLGENKDFQLLKQKALEVEEFQFGDSQFQGRIGLRDNKLWLEASEVTRNAQLLFDDVEMVTFTAMTTLDGMVESLQIQKGSFATYLSPLLQRKFAEDKILNPLARFLRNLKGEK